MKLNKKEIRMVIGLGIFFLIIGAGFTYLGLTGQEIDSKLGLYSGIPLAVFGTGMIFIKFINKLMKDDPKPEQKF